MYTIRLELGRELEDLLFRKMQAKRDEEELAAYRYRAKRIWYVKRIGKLSISSCYRYSGHTLLSASV